MRQRTRDAIHLGLMGELDAITTLFFLTIGAANEGNPVMLHLLTFSPVLFMVIKGPGVALLGYLLPNVCRAMFWAQSFIVCWNIMAIFRYHLRS